MATSIRHEKEIRRGTTEAGTRSSNWTCEVFRFDCPHRSSPEAQWTSSHLCGDYKMTVNKASTLEQYPIPTLENLITKLGKGSVYRQKLYLSHAYSQTELEPESRSLWHSTPIKVCSSTNASPMMFPVHQLNSRGLWSPCFKAYLQLLFTLMAFWWLEIQQLSHSRCEAEEVYFWCRGSCVPWPQDQQVRDQTAWWEGGGFGSSKTARKTSCSWRILGAP